MEITNNGACVRISNTAPGGTSAQTEDVQKSLIVKVDVIKTNIIRIDIGQGALYNIFIPFAGVTNPVTANADALKDAILAMLPQGSTGSGSATEAHQIEEIAAINALNTSIGGLSNLTTASLDKTLDEPLLVDDSGANIVYKGYAAIGAKQTDSQWAISRTQRIAEIDVTTWANGAKLLNNIWTNRETLTYS